MRAYSTVARAAQSRVLPLRSRKRRATLADTHRTSRLQEGTMALRVMSADSHMDLIYLPPDTFTSRMAATWGGTVPRVVERDGRKWWVSGDAVLGPYGVYGPGVTGPDTPYGPSTRSEEHTSELQS